VTAVCVSDSQRRGVEATLRRIGVTAQVRALTIYNPVEDALTPDGTPVDERKLIFFSSPNKGLNFTLDAFSALKRRMPDLRLVVGNPGYKAGGDARRAGVEFLGPQPQARIHAEVRSALCTFFPNFVIPETFGLVFAESHALGTPVLTHDCGAALEVVGDPRQLRARRARPRPAHTTPRTPSPPKPDRGEWTAAVRLRPAPASRRGCAAATAAVSARRTAPPAAGQAPPPHAQVPCRRRSCCASAHTAPAGAATAAPPPPPPAAAPPRRSTRAAVTRAARRTPR